MSLRHRSRKKPNPDYRPKKPGTLTAGNMIERLATEVFPWLPASIVREAFELIFSEMEDAIVRGDKVRIEGLGRFYTRDAPTRSRHFIPTTGERKALPEGRIIGFKTDMTLAPRVLAAHTAREIAKAKKERP